MNKVSPWWLFAVLILGIAAAWIYFRYFYEPASTVTINKRPNNNVVLLKLPNSVDTHVFGPKYWEAFHKLADMVPCGQCRSKAVPFIRFFHDVVNQRTEKPIFDRDNYNKHIDFISSLPKA